MKARTKASEWLNVVECEHGRRGRQDIIMGILRIAKNGSKKNNIIDKVKMSSAQGRNYLEDLKEAGYISEEQGIWKTTEKGFTVIEACKICHDLLNQT